MSFLKKLCYEELDPRVDMSFLKKSGYEELDPRAGTGTGKWYMYKNFTVGIRELHPFIEVMLFYSGKKMIHRFIDHEEVDDLQLLLKVVADPSQAPLLMSVPWAKNVMTQLLEVSE